MCICYDEQSWFSEKWSLLRAASAGKSNPVGWAPVLCVVCSLGGAVSHRQKCGNWGGSHLSSKCRGRKRTWSFARTVSSVVGLETTLNMGIIGWLENVPRLRVHVLQVSYCRNDRCYIPPAQAGDKMVELRYWSYENYTWTPSSVTGPQSPRSATLRGHWDRILCMSHTLRRFCFNREENEGKESKSSTWSGLEPVFVSSWVELLLLPNTTCSRDLTPVFFFVFGVMSPCVSPDKSINPLSKGRLRE